MKHQMELRHLSSVDLILNKGPNRREINCKATVANNSISTQFRELVRANLERCTCSYGILSIKCPEPLPVFTDPIMPSSCSMLGLHQDLGTIRRLRIGFASQWLSLSSRVSQGLFLGFRVPLDGILEMLRSGFTHRIQISIL